MKKLNTTPITSTAGFRFKSGTFDFLQLAYQECITELMTSRIGSSYDPTKGYILNGCVNSGSGDSYAISAGSVFFNGEVFLVDAVSVTRTGSNVIEGVIVTTQYVTNADPVNFTDGVARNVHNIRKIVFQNALSGSGAFDFLNAINLAYKPVGAIGQTVIWTMPGTGSQNSLLPTYFDGSGTGIHPLTLGWVIDPVLSGYTLAAFKSGDTTFGTIGQTQGAKTYKLLTTDIPELATEPKFAATPGSTLTFNTSNAAGINASVAVNQGSPNNPISLMQPTVTALYIKRVS